LQKDAQIHDVRYQLEQERSCYLNDHRSSKCLLQETTHSYKAIIPFGSIKETNQTKSCCSKKKKIHLSLHYNTNMIKLMKDE
jgi:hypothetical protein